MNQTDRKHLARLLELIGRIPETHPQFNTVGIREIARLSALWTEAKKHIRFSIMDIARPDHPDSDPDEVLDGLQEVIRRHRDRWDREDQERETE